MANRNLLRFLNEKLIETKAVLRKGFHRRTPTMINCLKVTTESNFLYSLYNIWNQEWYKESESTIR